MSLALVQYVGSGIPQVAHYLEKRVLARLPSMAQAQLVGTMEAARTAIIQPLLESRSAEALRDQFSVSTWPFFSYLVQWNTLLFSTAAPHEQPRSVLKLEAELHSVLRDALPKIVPSSKQELVESVRKALDKVYQYDETLLMAYAEDVRRFNQALASIDFSAFTSVLAAAALATVAALLGTLEADAELTTLRNTQTLAAWALEYLRELVGYAETLSLMTSTSAKEWLTEAEKQIASGKTLSVDEFQQQGASLRS